MTFTIAEHLRCVFGQFTLKSGRENQRKVSGDCTFMLNQTTLYSAFKRTFKLEFHICKTLIFVSRIQSFLEPQVKPNFKLMFLLDMMDLDPAAWVKSIGGVSDTIVRTASVGGGGCDVLDFSVLHIGCFFVIW